MDNIKRNTSEELDYWRSEAKVWRRFCQDNHLDIDRAKIDCADYWRTESWFFDDLIEPLQWTYLREKIDHSRYRPCLKNITKFLLTFL